jgi:hypothetical protein
MCTQFQLLLQAGQSSAYASHDDGWLQIVQSATHSQAVCVHPASLLNRMLCSTACTPPSCMHAHLEDHVQQHGHCLAWVVAVSVAWRQVKEAGATQVRNRLTRQDKARREKQGRRERGAEGAGCTSARISPRKVAVPNPDMRMCTVQYTNSLRSYICPCNDV